MGVDERRLDVPTEVLPLRPQDEVECRRCAVHCDKVVYPAMCIQRSCPFVYAYEEFGRTYIGCMQKIFDVEIDLVALSTAQVRRGGFAAGKRAQQRRDSRYPFRCDHLRKAYTRYGAMLFIARLTYSSFSPTGAT